MKHMKKPITTETTQINTETGPSRTAMYPTENTMSAAPPRVFQKAEGQPISRPSLLPLFSLAERTTADGSTVPAVGSLAPAGSPGPARESLMNTPASTCGPLARSFALAAIHGPRTHL